MKHHVTLIPGEGIGPEVSTATRRILEASGVEIAWEEISGRAGESADQGQRVNQAAIDSVRRNRVALKGGSEEHTSELQSHSDLVCRLLLEKKKKNQK